MTGTLSRDAETVLHALYEGGDLDPIDARHWSDAIVELLGVGYARLDGTLDRVELIITGSGEAHVASQGDET